MSGAAQTWVLLRGLTREARHWGSFPDLLRSMLPGVRVLTPDLPGNGVRWRERSPARVEDMLEDCRRLLARKEAAPPYYLLGLSLGGMLAAAWCRDHPREVAGAVLLNTSMRPFSPFHRRLRPANYGLLPLLLAGTPGWRETAILKLTSFKPWRHCKELQQWQAWRRECPVSAANALRQLVAAARFRGPLERAPAPLLVLAGARDRLVDPSCSERLAQAWHAQLAVHPAAGHDLPLDDGPWVAERLREWLAAASRPDAARRVYRT